jgi:hypothetical protein
MPELCYAQTSVPRSAEFHHRRFTSNLFQLRIPLLIGGQVRCVLDDLPVLGKGHGLGGATPGLIALVVP